jgi:ABC-2 type transport system ATP-binding protein
VASPAIETDGLTKRYGDAIGVCDLDLRVDRGEVFGFLGPNGAGKTTTIRLLLDLIRPTRGSARVLGMDVNEASLEVRHTVGYLPGELALWPDPTPRETVRHLAKVRGERVPEPEIERLAERLGVQMDRPVGELSSGNKQRVGLLQAFASRPEILILDEPTRGLDPLVQQEVRHLICEAREEGRTVFLSSHVLHEVEQVCDRVAIVREGELVTVEAVDELVHRSVRRMNVTFAEAPPADLLAGIEGVRDVHRDGVRMAFTVEGAIDPVLKRLAEREVLDVRSHEPSLEEVFLDRYEEDDGGA